MSDSDETFTVRHVQIRCPDAYIDRIAAQARGDAESTRTDRDPDRTLEQLAWLEWEQDLASSWRP